MAHPDLDKLLNVILPLAQQMLGKHGEYYPFGSSMTTEGQINPTGVTMAGNIRPRSSSSTC